MLSLENCAFHGTYVKSNAFAGESKLNLRIPEIAKKLELLQAFCEYEDFEFLFAQKTKGGVVLRNKKTNQETWIIEGIDPQEWPILSENSLVGVLHQRDDDEIWGVGQRLVTKMRIAPGLPPDVHNIATEVLDFLRDRN